MHSRRAGGLSRRPWRADFRPNNAGNILIITSSFSYGAYISVSRSLRQYGALNVITWIFLLGTLVTPAICRIRVECRQLARRFCWPVARGVLRHPGADRRRLLPELMGNHARTASVRRDLHLPAAATRVGLAPLVLGESWNSRTIVACILIFAGVAVVTIRGRSRALRKSQNIQMRCHSKTFRVSRFAFRVSSSGQTPDC